MDKKFKLLSQEQDVIEMTDEMLVFNHSLLHSWCKKNPEDWTKKDVELKHEEIVLEMQLREIEHEDIDLFDKTVTIYLPYKTISELPIQFKDLPNKAKRMAMHVINSALKEGSSEVSAFKQAWGAIKKSFKYNEDTGWQEK